MNNPSVNILDLPANLVGPPTGTVSGEIFPVIDGNAPVFDDLLSGLLASNGVDTPDQTQQADVPTAFVLDQLLSDGDDTAEIAQIPLGATDPKTDIASLVTASESNCQNNGTDPTMLSIVPNGGSLQDEADLIVGPKLSPSGETTAIDTDVDDNVLAFNRELNELFPQGRIANNESLRQILMHEPVTVESGRYQITDSKQIGQSLQMEVIADNADAEPIRITLPLDALTQKPETSAVAQRVAVVQPDMARAEFQRLVTSLNLKEIEVRVGTEGSFLSEDPTEVTIIGEEGSRRNVLEGKMIREDLQASKASSAAGKAAQPLPNADSRRPDLALRKDMFARQDSDRSKAAQPDSPRPQIADELLVPGFRQPVNITRAAQPIPSLVNGPTPKTVGETWLPESMTTADKVVGLTDTAAGNSGGMAGDMQSWLDKPSIEIAPSENGRVHRPVQFHLPDNIKAALKSHRQSITIQIEPEHLGPARLSLVERHGGMQATVVVDSAEAKSLIEGSLDKLARQLEKADIHIDKINVTVGGESHQRHAFNRHQAWHARQLADRMNSSEIDEHENPIPGIDSSAGPQGYLTPSGVNLLA